MIPRDLEPQTRRRAAVFAAASIVALSGSIALVDRPLALFAHEHLHGVSLFPLLTHVSDIALYGSMVGLAIAMVLALSGWRPGPIARSLIVAALATLVASVLKDQLKIAFGHTWPETWVDDNPSFIRDGVYGFFPFHGGRGWASFPSGHTAVIVAPVAALWRRFARLRWIGVALVATVIVGLLGANYHFVSDIVAGFLVGVAAGIGAEALLSSGENDPVTPPQ